MSLPTNQNLIAIEGAATYERILAAIRDIEIEEAIRHLQDFLKIYPEFAQAHNDLATLNYRTGNNLKALAHYEKAHKLDSANITYRKNLADFYFVELGWSDDAIYTYLDILKDNPFDVEALNSLGSISLSLGRREQARQYFSRSLQLDTRNGDARQALLQLGGAQPSNEPCPPSEACSPPPGELQPAAPAPVTPAAPILFPGLPPEPARSPEELHRAALTLANDGKPHDAVRLLEELLEQYGNYAPAHNDLGVLYQQQGDVRRSRRHHEEAVRLQPVNTVFAKNLADVLCIGFGEVEEALKIYVRLLTAAPQDIEILMALATICREVGQESDARFFLERILAVQPWHNDARATLAVLEGHTGAES